MVASEKLPHPGLNLPLDVAAHRLVVDVQTDRQVARTRSDRLEAVDAGGFLDHDPQRQRKYLHRLMLGGCEAQQVIGATLDRHHRKRTPAGTRLRLQHDPVTQVVPDDRLNAVGQVGHQRAVRAHTGRNRASVRVHRFQHIPVRVDVQESVGALDGESGYLGRGVSLGDRTPEGGVDGLSHGRGEQLPGAEDVHRVDPQPAGALFGSEQHEDAGVATEQGRLEGVQLRDQFVDRAQDREHSCAIGQKWTDPADTLGQRHSPEMTPGGEERSGSDPPSGEFTEVDPPHDRLGPGATEDVVDPPGQPVLEQDGRLPCGSGGRHHQVAAQIQPADAVLAGEEVTPKSLEGYIRIGDPVVEVGHQGGFVEDRQFAEPPEV